MRRLFSWRFQPAVSGVLLLCMLLGVTPSSAAKEIVVRPKEYEGPLRNPLMGFIGPINGKQEYATLAREYVPWNDIENVSSDTVDKIRTYTDTRWKGIEDRNIKVIPRVYLEWPKGSKENEYWPIDSRWPQDMPRSFDSDQFKARVAKMVEKMGQAWDNDPRIAFIEMGLIGPWGEQHHPEPTEEMQKILGDACKAAFKNKLVMNRYPWHFLNYDFGIYWDSFGNPGWEMRQHVPLLEGRLADRWKIAPMAGETAFTMDQSTKPRLGKDPTDALARNAPTLVQYIRRWHWTALGWISNYDKSNPAAARGAAEVQRAFGYRFVIDEARYPARVEPGGSMAVSFTVRNTGSAPLYYNWPVEASLLDAETHAPVWKATFPGVDTRTWLPGDFSDKNKGKQVGDKNSTGFQWVTGQEYDLKARTHRIKAKFRLPGNLPSGHYIVALAILDPAGNLPCARFAIENYFVGGRHPLGKIGVGLKETAHSLDKASFADPGSDQSLHYAAARQ